jgi:hypothetical protein
MKTAVSLSPLTEASFYILISLTTPLHGYGIMKQVEDLSRGRLKLAPGTLYGALSTLQQHHLIRQVEEPVPPFTHDSTERNPDASSTLRADASREHRRGKQSGREKKEYIATDLGISLISYETQRLAELAEHGRAALKAAALSGISVPTDLERRDSEQQKGENA